MPEAARGAVRLRGAWWRKAPLTPLVRRLLQLTAFALVALTPALQLWGVGTARVWSPAELDLRYGPWAGRASHLLRGWLGAPPDWLPGSFVGGAFSFGIGPVELADPIALLTLWLGGAWPAAGLALGAALVLVFHLVFGRLFCAVLCPYGMLSRLLARVRAPLLRRGLVHQLQLPGQLRWVVLGAVLVAPLFGGSIVALVLPYLAVSRWLHALFWGGLGASSVVVGTLLLSDLLLWENGVCRSLCPSGALQGLIGRFRLFRLQARADRRCDRGCQACGEACWLGLDPRGGAPDPDCDGCGRCASRCPNNRLEPMIRVPRGRATLLVAFLLGGAAFASVAEARAPALIDGTRSEASPFMPPADPERAAEIHFVEADHEGRAVSIGVARIQGEELGLRIYLEEAPGQPFTGPLSILLRNVDGEAELHFDGPRHPRSVPAPTLYEERLSMSLPAELSFLTGPAAGSRWTLPGPETRLPSFLLMPLSVVALWGILFLTRWRGSRPRRV